MLVNMRIVSITLISGLIVIAAYLGLSQFLNDRHLVGKEHQTLMKILAENTAASHNLLSAETSDDGITFGELFSAADERIKILRDTSIALQVSDLPVPQRNALLVYNTDLQNVLRRQRAKYQKNLQLSNALDATKDAVSDITHNSNSYTLDATLDRFRKSNAAQKTAFTDSVTAATEFTTSLTKLRSDLKSIKNNTGDVPLLDELFLSGIAAKTAQK